MGGFASLRGDYGMRRKICLRGGRIMVWKECSIEYPRDRSEYIRVTVGIYRIVDIRYCDSSCMDGKHPYEVIE